MTLSQNEATFELIHSAFNNATEPNERPQPLSLRDQLRAATRAAHDRVDVGFSLLNLADPADYRRFLEAQYPIVLECEALLEHSGAARLLADWPARIRAPSLADDLAALDGAASPVPSGRKSLDPATCFGMLYVLEGSRLGATVLLRRVLANPSQRCREATRFLRHGSGAGFWTSFVATLNVSAEVRADLQATIDAAVQTFARFENGMAVTPVSA